MVSLDISELSEHGSQSLNVTQIGEIHFEHWHQQLADSLDKTLVRLFETSPQLCSNFRLPLIKILLGQLARISLPLIAPLSNFPCTNSLILPAGYKSSLRPIEFTAEFNISPLLQ